MPDGAAPVANRARPRPLVRIGVALGTLLGLGLLVETSFRLAGGEPWYARLEREQAEDARPQPVERRPMGIPAALAVPPKEPGTYRLLFLGDSFTYGSGVGDGRRVFPSLVTDLLNARGAAGEARVESFNGGIPGSLTDEWVELLEAACAPFQPDLVVTVFFLRDGTRDIGGSRGHIRRIGRRMAELEADDWLFRTSRAYRYFRERSAQREFSREYLELMRRAYLGEVGETAEWSRARANLLQLRRASESSGARFVLILFPVLFELHQGYPLAEVCAEVDRFAAENGFVYHSLLPAFLGQDGPALWVSPLNQHPNERAHALAAESIAEFLAPLVRTAGAR